MKTLLTLFTCLSVSLSTHAEMASPETRLMKLSKTLLGVPASYEDREQLALAKLNNTLDSFFDQKTQTYLNDPKFNLKLKQKVDELLRFIPQEKNQSATEQSAYDNLVQEIILQNQSWDQLLTGKSYTAQLTSRADEFNFYDNLSPNYEPNDNVKDLLLLETKPESRRFTFDPQDQRVAGVLTTPRFLNRYVTTALNKNRRRAAAVFRIFMCDTMIPTVPKADAMGIMKDFDTILPDHKNVTEEQIRKSAAGNIHGQQADCMACHYKLDPLGQVFAFSGSTLAPKASAGALRYKGSDNRVVDIPLRGFADLGEEISKQPEYVQCQISHFWRWYMGKDVPLTAESEKKLIEVFNQVQRRPKDFIKHLVSLPEFKEKPLILSEDQLLSQRAIKILKNCTSCHDSTGEAVWDLAKLPYSGDQTRVAKKIDLLRKVLDISGNGHQASMPPKESLWQLSTDEFSTLKKWLDRGAPDQSGKAQVSSGGTP